MITQTETQVITLTPPQLKALTCACKYPSQATVSLINGHERHSRDDVAVLVKHQLVHWLDPVNFINTPAGIAYHERYHAIEKLKSAGWQIEATALRGWFLIQAPGKEAGMLDYVSIDAAWDDVLASEKVQS